MTQEHRDAGQSMLRGLMARCPNCGQGRLFRGYLQIVDNCDHCGEPLGEYRAADGPAFFTITILMLLLIPLIGFGWTLTRADPVTLLIWLGAITLLLTLVILRLVKGAFVGFLWSRHERDPGA